LENSGYVFLCNVFEIQWITQLGHYFIPAGPSLGGILTGAGTLSSPNVSSSVVVVVVSTIFRFCYPFLYGGTERHPLPLVQVAAHPDTLKFQFIQIIHSEIIRRHMSDIFSEQTLRNVKGVGLFPTTHVFCGGLQP
jgi:hypothetical protein